MGERQDWYYYTKNAIDYVGKNNIDKLNNRVVFKNDILVVDRESYDDLHSEVCKKISDNLDITIPYEDTEDLTYAVYFDKCWYPDETIFVTENSSTAVAANLFFGDDSIVDVSKER